MIRLSLPALLLLVAASAGCGVFQDEGRRAQRLYAAGRYREAYEAFRAMAGKQEVPAPVLAYDSGNALYRLGRYGQAEAQFRSALAGPAALRARGAYNLGNSLVKAAEAAQEKRAALRQAVGAYERTLLADPRDGEAKWNLELALRKLAEEEFPWSAARYRRRANWGTGNLTKSGYAGTQTAVGASAGGGFGAEEGRPVQELTVAQARKLLETVQRRQVQDMEGRGQAGPRKSGKRDW